MNGQRSKPAANVRFTIRDLGGEPINETLWAYDMGRDRYRLANLPFYAFGVSAHDIVLAPYDPAVGLPVFERVIIKSGNRTMRVAFNQRVNQGNESDRILNALIDMGCGAEGADGIVFAINIPARLDLHEVVSYVDRAGVDWEIADPC